MSSFLHAQTGAQITAQISAQPLPELTASLDSAPLPDAPRPTNPAHAVNDSPPNTSFLADLDQQASQTTPNNSSQAPSKLPRPPPHRSPISVSHQRKPNPTPTMQARLDRRTHMLKVHQELGLYTIIPIAAACISGAGATPSRNNYTSTTSRDVHVAIGGIAIAIYAATASNAIRAPRVADGPTRGGIKLHKYLIWIHAPGMILTPILGTMAFNDIENGHKPAASSSFTPPSLSQRPLPTERPSSPSPGPST